MKNNLRTIILGAFAMILFCALSTFAQMRVGGYKSVPTDDPTVIEASEFAVNTQSDRSRQTINIEVIKKAFRQVVAGTNYKICMQVAVGEEESETKPSVQFVEAVVFYNLKREYTLKSWTKADNCN